MKNKKFFIIISLILCLSLTNSNLVFAYEVNSHVNDSTNIEQLILKEALETDSKLSIADKDSFYVVNDSVGTYNGLNIVSQNNNQQPYIQRVEEKENNMVAVTTILPYHINEDGMLVNSFQYAEQLQNTPVPCNVVVPSTLVDVTVTVTTLFAHYQGQYTGAHYYRHAGIYAYWSSSKSLTMNNMLVRYESCGELHKYPECLTVRYPEDSLDTTATNNRNYKKKSVISVAYPTKGKEYIDGKNAMPFNRVLYITDYFNHGGLVYIQVIYTINGSKKTYDTNYYVYKK